MQDTITVSDGTVVRIAHLEALPNGDGRFDVAADSRRWRIDGAVRVVASRRAGQLEDVPLPDWIDDVVARLQRV